MGNCFPCQNIRNINRHKRKPQEKTNMFKADDFILLIYFFFSTIPPSPPLSFLFILFYYFILFTVNVCIILIVCITLYVCLYIYFIKVFSGKINWKLEKIPSGLKS